MSATEAAEIILGLEHLLPGFELNLAKIFAVADRWEPHQ
jgi:hypothetical protein